MTKYYVSSKVGFKNIPDANYYVTSVDIVLSGWGPAQDKINVCVVPCSSLEEAEKVKKYVEKAKSQMDIKIIDHKPLEDSNILYSLLEDWVNFVKEKEVI